MDIKFYAADLAAYNNGHLRGVWVEATSDEADMPEKVAAMLTKSPCPGADRWKERSRFFPGIAAAMADQWGGAAQLSARAA
ncbi:hypothetical protein MACH17_18450 [Phaeobacter inhibens]|uniref:antirestriction protein ArdA n=1 Tax=Phaeobacter inhibens TaxID=221822 RepID=UPI002765C065|nr:hypothetical protein MACH17_18450 [Phaeobacter inhibens]